MRRARALGALPLLMACATAATSVDYQPERNYTAVTTRPIEIKTGTFLSPQPPVILRLSSGWGGRSCCDDKSKAHRLLVRFTTSGFRNANSDLVLIIDGQRYVFPRKFIENDPVLDADQFRNRSIQNYTVIVERELLEKLARAKDVEGVVQGLKFQVQAPHQDTIRRYLAAFDLPQ